MLSLLLLLLLLLAPPPGSPLPLRLPPLTSPPPLPLTYSNPTGALLTPVRPGLYLAERPFYPSLPGLASTDVSCKMAIAVLPSGRLWLHSPVQLTPALAEALAALGEVAFIVTPNTEHQKYAPQWIDAYPSARSYACPNLRPVDPPAPWGEFLRPGAPPPPEWEGAIEMCLVPESVPGAGRPFFNEVVFLHRTSRALLCTDLYWNYPSSLPSVPVPRSTRLWKFFMDKPYRAIYNRILADRPAFTELLEKKVLGDWDWDYIAPCHGEPVEEDAKGVLRRHLNLA